MQDVFRRVGLSILGALGATSAACAVADPDPFDPGEAKTALGSVNDGEKVFEEETFDGATGRTCATCHGEAGQLTLAEIAARYRHDLPPTAQPHPLFRHDARDVRRCVPSTPGELCYEFVDSFDRFLKDGTVAVRVPLAPNVSIAEAPSARSLLVYRSIPSTFDLDDAAPLMWDGRQANLAAQATGAVADHYGAGARAPTAKEIEDVVAYELSLESPRVAESGGTPPALPCDPSVPRPSDGALSPTGWDLDGAPCSDRMRLTYETFFEDGPAQTDRKVGICASCHSGPRLDRVSSLRGPNPLNDVFDVKPGDRFTSVFVAETNKALYPEYTFLFRQPDGTVKSWTFPDPGQGGITGQWEHAGMMKIPTLWNVKNSAPYFHDNSARTLEDVMGHYQQFFTTFRVFFTPDDVQAIVEYLRLL